MDYKLKVIEYTKQYGDGAAVRRFNLPSTEKLIHYWRNQEDLFGLVSRLKSNVQQSAVKGPELEQEMKE